MLFLFVSLPFVKGCITTMALIELYMQNTSKCFIRIFNDAPYRILTYVDFSKVDPYINNFSFDNYHYMDSLLEFGAIEPKDEALIEDIHYLEVRDFKKGDTLSVFVFNLDTLYKYPWDVIKSEYKICARYDYTKETITVDRLYNIHYPPTEDMKDIHMYPSYEAILEQVASYKKQNVHE